MFTILNKNIRENLHLYMILITFESQINNLISLAIFPVEIKKLQVVL